MRLKYIVTGMLVLLFGFVLTGCAGMSTSGPDDVICTSIDLGELLQSVNTRKK